MIVEERKYYCPNCMKGYFITTKTDNEINYCEKCNILLKYSGTYLIDREANKIIKQIHQAEPSEEAKKIIANSQPQPKSKPTVTCPYCKSTNTVKISGLYKAASIGLFGLFAVPGATKQWTCKDCKSDF